MLLCHKRTLNGFLYYSNVFFHSASMASIAHSDPAFAPAPAYREPPSSDFHCHIKIIMPSPILILSPEEFLMQRLKTNNFSLQHSLECGQAFRWEKKQNGFYYGLISNTPIKIKQEGNGLIFDSYKNKINTAHIKNYFALDLNLNEILSSIGKDANIARAATKYPGMRILRQEPWETLSSTLSNAQVDLNPHQIEAALFAFRSPLSKGAILADEVGLGKTIEAGLVLSQKWAERKRKILLIVPSSLRKQWNDELQEKFFLPSIILEAKSFNQYIKDGNLNPFNQEDKIIICSYHFAKAKSPYIKQTKWDLAVIDEAHRLRNVYKTSNKIAREIKDSLIDVPKILLTATPLKNSLLELYGLVSIIDDHVFGDLKSFKSNYARVPREQDIYESEVGLVEPKQEMFVELRKRLKPVCTRTLRRQVLIFC